MRRLWLSVVPLLALSSVLGSTGGAADGAASLADRIVFVGTHSGHEAVLAVSPGGTRTKLTPWRYPAEVWGDIGFDAPGEVSPYDVAVSPDGSRVVFGSRPDGDALDLNGELFSVAADGSDFRRLTFTPQVETNPVYSPDGSKLAFLRDATVDELAIRLGRTRISVVVANSDGTNARVLAQAPRSAPTNAMELAWHPDSKRLLFRYERRSRYTISLINTSSGARQALYGRYAEFSPDGKLLAVLWDKPLGSQKRYSPRIYVGTLARFTKSAFTRTKPLVSSVQNKSGRGVFQPQDFTWLPGGRILYLGGDERGEKRCPTQGPSVRQTVLGVVSAQGRQRIIGRVCGGLGGLSVSPSGTAILSEWYDRCARNSGCRGRLSVSGTAAWRPRVLWPDISHRPVWGYEPTSKSYERRPQ